jgi:MerR family transcriptional regulator, heat shock protein HspR
MTLDGRLQTYCSVEVAAHLAGVSVPRVRRLVRSGLVRPPVVERGRPLFGEAELARLRKIRRLTNDLGVNLAGVEIILRLTDELGALRGDWQRVSPETTHS